MSDKVITPSPNDPQANAPLWATLISPFWILTKSPWLSWGSTLCNQVNSSCWFHIGLFKSSTSLRVLGLVFLGFKSLAALLAKSAGLDWELLRDLSLVSLFSVLTYWASVIAVFYPERSFNLGIFLERAFKISCPAYSSL